MFINEKGEIIPATIITTLIAQEILRDNPGQKILVDIRYIKNVQKMVTKMGGTIGLTPVGHALITQQVNEEKAIFAGESSGHYYFLNTAGCESTVRVILYVLRVLGRENRPISEIINSMMVSYESGESNFKLPESVTSQEVIKNICAKYSDGTLNEIDGIAISYDDWRFSIRSSNTEPLIRLNVEGDQIDKVKSEEKKLQDLIIGFGAHKEE
jgi:phosphomannomutase